MGEIKGDVQRMVKRRKDSGFTLIELMIVIAIIGILAVVLVPKMGGVKDSAKATGAITNAKSVEAYVITNIDKWIRTSDTTPDSIASELQTKFSGNTNPNALTNPYNSSTTVIIAGDADGKEAVQVVTDTDTDTIAVNPDKGVVVVDVSKYSTDGIEITGYGTSEKDIVANLTVKPN